MNKGLNKDEVIKSRKEYATNEIIVHKKNKFLSLLLESLGDPIIKILLIACCIFMQLKCIRSNRHYMQVFRTKTAPSKPEGALLFITPCY